MEGDSQLKDNVGNIGDYEGQGVGETEVEYLQSVNSPQDSIYKSLPLTHLHSGSGQKSSVGNVSTARVSLLRLRVLAAPRPPLTVPKLNKIR